MKLLSSLVLVSLIAAAPACKKKSEPAPAQGTAQTAGSGSAKPAPAEPAPTPTKRAGVDGKDFIAVYASHTPSKPVDPVEIVFDKYTVTKATFDPKNLEGGTATIELDLAGMSTDSEKRTGHLKSPSYFDIGQFATATIDVANVKQKANNQYTADATVKLHGAEKTYPVTFEVLETQDDGTIKVRGEQDVQRLDFKVGQEPSKDELVDKTQTVRLQLTLKNT
jgi:polyisoprenoid-binding protein YceI